MMIKENGMYRLKKPFEMNLVDRIITLTVRTGLVIGSVVAVSFCNEYLIPKTIENTKVKEVGTTTLKYYPKNNSEIIAPLEYQEVPFIFVDGYNRCVAGRDLINVHPGDELSSLVLRRSFNDNCDYSVSYEKK